MSVMVVCLNFKSIGYDGDGVLRGYHCERSETAVIVSSRLIVESIE